MGSKHTLEVGVHVAKGIVANAKGHPAKIVAYGTAAGVVILATGIAYAGYRGVEYLTEGGSTAIRRRRSR